MSSAFKLARDKAECVLSLPTVLLFFVVVGLFLVPSQVEINGSQVKIWVIYLTMLPSN